MKTFWNKISLSLKNIDYRTLFALFFLGLMPTIYTTVRVFLLGQLPGEYSYSIAGQLSWINLIFEILNEAIILPLFFFIGKVIDNKEELINRIKTGLIITFVVFLFLAIVLIIFVKPLLMWMAVSNSILDESISYIRIEVIANIFSTLLSFCLVVLTLIGKSKYLYIFTAIKLFLSLILDTFFVSTIPFSLNLGINGIGYSNIISSVLLLILVVFIFYKEEINLFSKGKISFIWMKDFAKIGGISGLESFVRNLAYMVMISKMVNVVSESGTYWVANNFIWGWLLLPVVQLAELIKKDTSKDKDTIRKNTLGYIAITFIVIVIWMISIPLWKPFMGGLLQIEDADKVISLVLILLGFYVLYAFQNIFDSTFYGVGKTGYMLFQSIVTNTIYYGTAFVLYKVGLWAPSLVGIALLFGIGMAFDSIVSLIAYIHLLKKENISILDVCHD